MPPGWSAWHTVLKADTDHYFYGYSAQQQRRRSSGPFGDPGSWETREYGVRDDFGCPFAPTNGLPCYYADRRAHQTWRRARCWRRRPNSPSTCSSTTRPRTATSADPAGPEPALRHYDWFKGARLPHDRSEGLRRGQRDRQAPLHPRRRPPDAEREAHLPHLLPEAARVAARRRRRRQAGDRHARRRWAACATPTCIFTSDNGFFFGEHRLLGGKFLAYEPATHLPFLIRGPGIKPGSATGELVANVDVAPTLLELAGAEADKSIDGRSLVPYLETPNCAAAARSSSSPSSRRATSRPRARSQPRRGSGGGAHGLAPGAAQGLRRNPPRPLQVHRLADRGEGALQHQQRPLRAQLPAKVPNFFPIRNFLHRQMKRLLDCVGRVCREVTPPLPLTRIEFQRLRPRSRRNSGNGNGNGKRNGGNGKGAQ